MEFAHSREIGTNCSVMSHKNAPFINLFRSTNARNGPAAQTHSTRSFIVLRLHIRIPIHGNFALVSLVDKGRIKKLKDYSRARIRIFVTSI